MPPTAALLIDHALWYASLGHPVFPCHAPTPDGCSCRDPTCTNVGKHPRTLHGHNDATTDPEQIRRWWGAWPQANIGLRTGVSLTALDIDPRHAGDATLHMLEHQYEPLPDTPLSHTGSGGQHRCFATVEGLRSVNGILEGIDLKAEGGFIIVPPSLHVSGKAYVWDSVYDLEDFPLAPMPAWLLTLLHDPHGTRRTPGDPDAPIPSGQRNETLSRFAFHMRKAGMSLDAIGEALLQENTRCTPPLTEEELRKIVQGKAGVEADPILKLPRGTKEAPAEPRTWPMPTPGTALLSTSHPTPHWIIPGLMVEGLTIIGGLPKVAKSYLAYDLVLACAGHGLGLGHFGVARGKALYLAIEDDPADTQQRVRELRPGIASAEDVYFLHGEAVPSISEGLVEFLRHIVTTLGLTLVVVDPLSYVYDPQTNKYQDSFREAKEMLLPLRQLARELHFALVCVDHRRKQGKDDYDVFQTLYGSVAKYAVADTLIMAVRKDEEVVLHCRGRKIKDQAISCTFTFQNEQAIWTVQGAHEEYASNTLRAKIRTAFTQAAQQHTRIALSVTDVMNYAGLEDTALMRNNLRTRLFTMYKAGELMRTDRGLYIMTGEDDSAGVVI